MQSSRFISDFGGTAVTLATGVSVARIVWLGKVPESIFSFDVYLCADMR